MPRKILPQISIYPFHISARTVNREAFPLPLDRVWEIFAEELTYCHFNYSLRILNFVLMPNHFHMLARSKELPLGSAMLHLMKTTSCRINQEAGRINHLWGGPYWRTILESPNYFFNTYKYVYQNPQRAGLTRYCEEWRYSTLHQLIGLSKLEIPLEEDTILFTPGFRQSELSWINTPIKNLDLVDIRKALRSSVFKYPRKAGSTHQLNSAKI